MAQTFARAGSMGLGSDFEKIALIGKSSQKNQPPKPHYRSFDRQGRRCALLNRIQNPDQPTTGETTPMSSSGRIACAITLPYPPTTRAL